MNDGALYNNGFTCLAFYLFRKTGLLEITQVSQSYIWRFFDAVNRGYRSNPYHNAIHGADVMLTTHFMFQSEFFKQHMTIWDQFAAYIGALCHDLGHMGFNNNWYINTAGNLALLYGDEAVLENLHVAETFRILMEPKSNWMASFPSSIRRYMAAVIRRTILATDMKVHGQKVVQLQEMVDKYEEVSKCLIMNHKQTTGETISKYQALCNMQLWRCETTATYASLDRIKEDGFKLFRDTDHKWSGDVIVKDLVMRSTSASDLNVNNNNKLSIHQSRTSDVYDDYDDNMSAFPHKPRIANLDDERLFILEITIHACDISNPTKPLPICKKWANAFLTEAFNQGDEERRLGIPVSAGMDRFTGKLPTSQIGFIRFVVRRLFELYADIVDEAQVCVKHMNENEKYWNVQKQALGVAKNSSSNTSSSSSGSGSSDSNGGGNNVTKVIAKKVQILSNLNTIHEENN